MSVRKAISGSVSYKDLMKGGKLGKGFGYAIKEDENGDKFVYISRIRVVEPELTPTEATKEIVKPLVLAVEDNGERK